jgi:hypothetical protein
MTLGGKGLRNDRGDCLEWLAENGVQNQANQGSSNFRMSNPHPTEADIDTDRN